MDRDIVYKSVVRIKCCKDKSSPMSECSVGTGFFIDKNTIITVKHVIQKYYTQGYSVFIEPINLGIENLIQGHPEFIEDSNCPIAFIKINEDVNVQGIKFTSNCTIKEDDDWFSFGHPQIKWNKGHVQEGKVLRRLNKLNSENADLDLMLYSGLDNYRGFSGSPLVINDSIVGLIQDQVIYNNKAQSLGAISIDFIRPYLRSEYLIRDVHKEKLKEIFKQYTEMQISKNIKNKKYIPDVFVEMDAVKEKVRYITDPSLFWNKIIEDIERFKFNSINSFLERFELESVEIKIPDAIRKNDDFYNVKPKAQALIEVLESVIDVLHELNKNKLINKVREELRHDFIESSYKIEMPRFEWKMKEFIELLNIFTYDILLLTENAGQGKTNFVCDLTSNVLLKKGITCIYFNANEFNDCNIKKYIEDRILNRYGYNFNDALEIIKEICIEENKPFVIVIDGLNENSNIVRFKTEIENFTSDICKDNFVKIILTCRTEYFNERFGNLLESSFSDRLLHIEQYNRRLKGAFKDRLFNGYTQFFNIKFSNITEEVFEKLTNDTLLFRIFCEAYGNHQSNDIITLPAIYDIYKFEVFEKYFEYKIKEIQKKQSRIPGVDNSVLYKNLINKVLKYMIDNHKFSNIPKEIINLENEIRLFTNLIDEDVIFRQDIIINKGLLMENQETISFTFDEFRDYLISRKIMESYGSLNEEEYCKLITSLTNKECEIAEGISKYLFFASKKYKDEKFEKILICQEWYAATYWYNIFEVEDKLITYEDIKRIEKAFAYSVSMSSYIISKLLRRYDDTVFNNLNINSLFNYILRLNQEQYARLIIPVFEPERDKYRYYGYMKPKDHIVIPIDEYLKKIEVELEDYDENSKEHNLIDLFILISDIDYCLMDFIEMYYKRFPVKLLDKIERLLALNNERLNSNIESIARSISYLEVQPKDRLNNIVAKFDAGRPKVNNQDLKSLLEGFRTIFDDIDNE